MNTVKRIITAGLVLAAAGASVGQASAATKSGGRQGPNCHGYSYTATRTGNNVTGGVQTNGGYGATLNHAGGVNAYGARVGTTSVTSNNGSSVTTHGAAYNGVAGGVVAVTGPDGQTVYGGGAVYVPH